METYTRLVGLSVPQFWLATLFMAMFLATCALAAWPQAQRLPNRVVTHIGRPK